MKWHPETDTDLERSASIIARAESMDDLSSITNASVV
jgi:hypothetical protein